MSSNNELFHKSERINQNTILAYSGYLSCNFAQQLSFRRRQNMFYQKSQLLFSIPNIRVGIFRYFYYVRLLHRYFLPSSPFIPKKTPIPPLFPFFSSKLPKLSQYDDGLWVCMQSCTDWLNPYDALVDEMLSEWKSLSIYLIPKAKGWGAADLSKGYITTCFE